MQYAHLFQHAYVLLAGGLQCTLTLQRFHSETHGQMCLRKGAVHFVSDTWLTSSRCPQYHSVSPGDRNKTRIVAKIDACCHNHATSGISIPCSEPSFRTTASRFPARSRLCYRARDHARRCHQRQISVPRSDTQNLERR